MTLEERDYMIYISDQDGKTFEEFYPLLKVKKDKVVVKGSSAIPSKLYPLTNPKKINLFCYYNTEPLEDEVVKEVFDSMKFETGRCYTNTKRLISLLNKRGIFDVEAFVGWAILDDKPIHHCWAVYKNNYVLDGGATLASYEAMKYVWEHKIGDKEEQKKIFIDIHKKHASIENHKSKTFGQVIPTYVYVGTPDAPDNGVDIYNQLMKDFPNHPSYAKMERNEDNATPIQVELRKL